MRLPISIAILTAIVVIVLVVVVVFFLSTGGFQMTLAQAEKTIADRCVKYCPLVKEQGLDFIVTLRDSDPVFIEACKVKYNIDIPNICLRQCGGDCSVTWTKQEELCKTAAYPGTAEEVMKNCEKLAALPAYSSVGVSCKLCNFRW
jgi:hypothetical protein